MITLSCTKGTYRTGSSNVEKNQHKLLHTFTGIFIPPTRSLCQILPRCDPWSKCTAMLIQRHVPCYITHCSVQRHTYASNAHICISLFLSACEGFATDLSHSLQAVPRMVVAGEWEGEGGGRAAAEVKEPSLGRARPAQPTTTSAVSLEPPRILSSIANSGGNVSHGVDQETSVPKQGASCPDTALPVGYVRTFLPFTLSPYMCLSPTPLAGCPSASCLRAMACFFPPVCALEVWKSVWELVWTHFAIIQQTKIIRVATNLSHMWPYADVWCTEDPRRSRTVDRAINLILVFSDICFTSR